MKISIVVPIYNIEKYAGDCIDSILRQTYKEFELLLIDDGSTDKSSFICDEYAKKDSRIKVIHQKNSGLASARNTGIINAIGEYLYFVDGDDLIHENTLKSFIEVLYDDPDVDFIMGRMSYFVDGLNIFTPDEFKLSKSLVQGKNGEEAFVEIMNNLGIIRMGVRGLYKRTFLTDNDLLFNGLCRYSEDQEWTFRLFLKANSVSSNDKPYYFYRQNRDGSLMNTPSEKKAIYTLNIYKEWAQYLKNNDVSDSFYKVMIKELGKRYIFAFVIFSTLHEKDKNEFYRVIDETKYIFKYAYYLRDKIINAVVAILGVRITSNLIRILLKCKRKMVRILKGNKQ